MPTTAKESGPSDPAQGISLPFEEGLKRLESIVESMESEDLPLETLLAKYEEGTKLAKLCQDKLAAAELKIQKLETSTGGELLVKPISPSTAPTED